MQVERNSIRCIYTVPDGEILKVIGVKENVEPVQVGQMSNIDANTYLSAINTNNIFNFDTSIGSVTSERVINTLASPTDYKAPNRVYVYGDGDQVDISYIFINRIRKAVRRGQVPKYCIAGIKDDGSAIPLFSIPVEKVDESELHLINFEVERLLKTENINILDEEDTKLLFQLALEYVQELRVQ